MLFQRIANIILEHKILEEGDSVIVAVSGGPDSVALLHLLHALPLQLKIIGVYIDHGLRPHETPDEVSLVKQYCQQLKVPFRTAQVDASAFKQRKKISLEEAARILRYQELEIIRSSYDAKAIAVGHTADDQIEELLIRLIRGTGRKGLSGMKVQNGYVIRPLLKEHKTTLLSYLKEHNIVFCQDSTNLEPSFLRNKIRLDLLPYLEKHYNNSIRQNVLQLTNILSQEEELLETLTEKDFKRVVSISSEEDTPQETWKETLLLDIFPFLECHTAIQRRILEKICWQMGTKPGFRQIEQLRNLSKNGEEGAEIHLKKGLRIHKRGQRILFTYPFGKKSFRGVARTLPEKIFLHIPEPGSYRVEGIQRTLSITLQEISTDPQLTRGLKLDAGALHFPLILRTPIDGERFTPFGMGGSKKISRFFSDRKVPRSKRPLFPVLLSEDNIIAIVGQEIDNRFRLGPETKSILLVDWR